MEAKARPRRANETFPATIANAATSAAPARALQRTQADVGGGADWGEETEASHGISHQPTDEDRSPPDLVGDASCRVLASQRGDEVGRHDDTDQGIGRTPIPQVLGQQREDRGRPEPQEERRESEGSDEGLDGRVRSRW